MSTYKKTIMLKNAGDTNNKSFGILTLDRKNNSTFGEFKMYNTNATEYILAIKSNQNIYKQNINLINKKCLFKCNKDIDIDSHISCILFDSHQGNLKQILYGSENNRIDNKTEILSSIKSSINKIQAINNNRTESTVKMEDDNKINTNEAPDEVYNKIAPDEQIAIAKSQAQLFESSDDEVEDIIDNNMTTNNHKFYDMIAEQLDDLFAKYPSEENLQKLIDESKWVKINHDYDNKYYVVGIIYKDNEIKYIGYGVPGTYNTEQPKELIGYSQWLPTDVTDPYNNGYWIMFQDADTGENVRLE